MILLDENITHDQKIALEKARYKIKQVVVDVLRKGTQDEQIISWLQKQNRIVFCTLDDDFYKAILTHSSYCILHLDVERDEVSFYIRKFFRHAHFNSWRKQSGKIIRLSHAFISFYSGKDFQLKKIKW